MARKRSKGKPRVSVSVSQTLIEALDAEAEVYGVSRSKMAAWAMAEYLAAHQRAEGDEAAAPETAELAQAGRMMDGEHIERLSPEKEAEAAFRDLVRQVVAEMSAQG